MAKPGRRLAFWRMVLVGTTLAVAIVYGVFLWMQRPPNPVWGDKKLSGHLRVAFGATAQRQRQPRLVSPAKDAEVQLSLLAIRELGPECIPLLQEWLQCDRPFWHSKFASVSKKLGVRFPTLEQDRRRIACLAAIELREFSAPLVPQLLACATNKSQPLASLACTALTVMQPKPPSDLDRVVSAMLPIVRLGPRLVGRHYDFKAEACLNSWDPSYQLRNGEGMAAAWGLGDGQIAPRRVVPVLIADLSSSNSAVVENRAIVLGKYGTFAQSALPMLSQLVDHSKRYVRVAASNAISEIQEALGASAVGFPGAQTESGAARTHSKTLAR